MRAEYRVASGGGGNWGSGGWGWGGSPASLDYNSHEPLEENGHDSLRAREHLRRRLSAEALTLLCFSGSETRGN